MLIVLIKEVEVSNKILFKEPTFYIPVMILFTLSLGSAILIILNSKLEWNWSYIGFNYAITIFKVPLGIFAICGTWAALAAANHRSQLMIQQIEETSSQNVFTNYFKHLEEFQKYIDKNTFLSKNLLNVRDTHDALYGSFDIFTPRVKLEVKDKIHNQVVKVYNILRTIDHGGKLDIELEIKKWNMATSFIERTLNIEAGMTNEDVVVKKIEGHGVPYPKDYVVLMLESGRLFGVLELAMKFSIDSYNSAAFTGLRQAISINRSKGMNSIHNPLFDYMNEFQIIKPIGLGLKEVSIDGLIYLKPKTQE
ncbi:hypothetical protein AB4178_22470 [Vibrio splendidus]